MSNAAAVIAYIENIKGFTKDSEGRQIAHGLTFDETCEMVKLSSFMKLSVEQLNRLSELQAKFQEGLNRFTFWRTKNND
jgi:hypothetical protein